MTKDAKFTYTVRKIRAKKTTIRDSQNHASNGIEFVPDGEFQCGSLQEAKKRADSIQEELDADCDPVRAYVFNGTNPVPSYAALQMKEYGGYRERRAV